MCTSRRLFRKLMPLRFATTIILYVLTPDNDDCNFALLLAYLAVRSGVCPHSAYLDDQTTLRYYGNRTFGQHHIQVSSLTGHSAVRVRTADDEQRQSIFIFVRRTNFVNERESSQSHAVHCVLLLFMRTIRPAALEVGRTQASSTKNERQVPQSDIYQHQQSPKNEK